MNILDALVKLLSSGVELVPEVMAFINAVRAQSGLTDEEILAHAKAVSDENTTAIVAERLRLLAEIGGGQ